MESNNLFLEAVKMKHEVKIKPKKGIKRTEENANKYGNTQGKQAVWNTVENEREKLKKSLSKAIEIVGDVSDDDMDLIPDFW